jgi:sulfur carrier protein
MKVIVNGDEIQLGEDANLMDLLKAISLGEAKVAIELNQSIVPRSQHAGQQLSDGDRVEIVHAIGGG